MVQLQAEVAEVWVLEYVADHAAGDVLGVYRDPEDAKTSLVPDEEWKWDEKWERWWNRDGSLEIRKFRLQ